MELSHYSWLLAVVMHAERVYRGDLEQYSFLYMHLLSSDGEELWFSMTCFHGAPSCSFQLPDIES
jgi:hypothetical protein